MQKSYRTVGCWKSVGFHSVTDEQQCRHFMATGETGSGKTASVVVPALEALVLHDRAEQRRPALIIDPKKELTPVVQEALNGQGEEMVNFHGDGTQIWLFSDKTLHEKTAAEIIEVMFRQAPSSSEWSERDLFWQEGAQYLLKIIIELDLLIAKDSNDRNAPLQFWQCFLEYCYKQHIVIVKRNFSGDQLEEKLRNLIQQQQREKQSLADMSYLKRVQRILQIISCDITNEMLLAIGIVVKNNIHDEKPHQSGWAFLEKYLQDHLSYEKLPAEILGNLRSQANNTPKDTYDSYMSVLNTMLYPLLEKTLLRKINFDPIVKPGDCFDPTEMINKGRVVVFSPPVGQERSQEIVGRLLKESFFKALLVEERLNNKGVPIFSYACDEFQRYVTWDEYSGEQSFLDRCRAYRVSCLFATQSQSSLLYKCGGGRKGELAVSIMMNNIGNKFFFRTTDPATKKLLKDNLHFAGTGPHLVDVRPPSNLEPGACYYLLSNGKSGRGQIRLD